MPSLIPSDPGTIVFVRIQFSDGSDVKKRPAVILSVPKYHEQHSDAILVALTTNVDHHYGDCLLDDWRSAGLPKPTKAKAFLATVDRATFERKVGVLSHGDFQRVRESIRQVLGF